MVDPGLAGGPQIGNLITSNPFVTFLAGWLASAALFGLVTYCIRFRARITFAYSDRPSDHAPEGLSGTYAVRGPGMLWEGQWPASSSPYAGEPQSTGPGPTQASPKPPSSSQPGSAQAGFLHMPRMPSRSDMGAWAKRKAQRALFMLLTDRKVWRGLLRTPAGLLRRTLKTLSPKLVYCEVAHPQPETLGKLAAWHASVAYAIGYPQPIHFDFAERALRLQGEVQIEVRLLHLLTWVFRSSSDLPWWPMLRALWRGTFNSTLPGGREKALRLILAIFRHLGKPSG